MNFDWKYNYHTIGIVAKSRSGKTTLAKTMIDKLSQNDILVLDTNLEYANIKNRYMPKDYDPSILDDFILKCRKDKNKLVLMDDIDMYNPMQSHELTKLCINGRHQMLGVCWLSRRLKQIDKRLLMNSDYLFLGIGAAWEDLDYLSNIVNISMDEYRKVQQYQFLAIDMNNQQHTIIDDYMRFVKTPEPAVEQKPVEEVQPNGMDRQIDPSQSEQRIESKPEGQA